ncbi:tryptophan biosynthesis modulator TrpM [Streptomyces sp. NPDC060223]|uniref:tryptophan biosynthesis modulator TrpM n=1 Tax=unclassified Streptomyces TaxID=2593676 RepID=UPI00363E7F89
MPASPHADATSRPGLRPGGGLGCLGSARVGSVEPRFVSAAQDGYARLARGCRPRGCRAPARRIHGRRVRYVIGDEPGQVNGMRWRLAHAR